MPYDILSVFTLLGVHLKIECEWDRLRTWAIDNRIITRLDGPADMISTILRLVGRMEAHIQDLNGQIDGLKLKEKK